jgi:DUF4097 and DUF4098 domain-containing protein YvlB
MLGKNALQAFLWGFLLFPIALQAGHIEKTFPVAAQPNLILKSQSGWITIRGWQRQEIRIVATHFSNNVEIDIENNNSKVSVNTHVLDQLASPDKVKVDYQVFVPEKSNVEVNTQLGGVLIEGISGEIRVDVFQAAVKIMGVSGFVNAKTLNSKLEVLDSKGTIQTKTVTGDIWLIHLESNSVSAESTVGNILYDSPFFSRGSYSFSTNDGWIRILCREQDSVELNARTIHGKIQSDLPILSKKHSPLRLNNVGLQSLLGTLNSGDATIRITTFNGLIQILKKP